MQQLTPSNPPIIAIIGLGYVGLPLALAFSKHYQVIGYDLNHARVDALKKGEDTTLETDAEAIKNANHLVLTSDLAKIASATVFIVTVPTPVNADKSPDLSSLLYASSQIASLLKRGDIVIYESTVYPGCTEEDCVPVLEKKSGLKFNIDFYCGYSPERINPGDNKRRIENITKIVAFENKKIFKKVTCKGFAHDFELLLLLKKNSIEVKNCPVIWHHRKGSKLNIFTDSFMYFFWFVLFVLAFLFLLGWRTRIVHFFLWLFLTAFSFHFSLLLFLFPLYLLLFFLWLMHLNNHLIGICF